VPREHNLTALATCGEDRKKKESGQKNGHATSTQAISTNTTSVAFPFGEGVPPVVIVTSRFNQSGPSLKACFTESFALASGPDK
jgi:hypothetical protein